MRQQLFAYQIELLATFAPVLIALFAGQLATRCGVLRWLRWRARKWAALILALGVLALLVGCVPLVVGGLVMANAHHICGALEDAPDAIRPKTCDSEKTPKK